MTRDAEKVRCFSAVMPSNNPEHAAVSLLRFLEEYGREHRAEVEALWSDQETEHLVLFADSTRTVRAILPVGRPHEYKRLRDAMAAEIDGLRARLATPALGITRPGRASADWQLAPEDHAIIARECPQSAAALAEAIQAGIEAGAHPVSAALTHLAHHTRDLVRRERYVTEVEEKLGARAQAITEHIAELEQREFELMNRISAVERRERATSTPFPISLSHASH